MNAQASDAPIAPTTRRAAVGAGRRRSRRRLGRPARWRDDAGSCAQTWHTYHLIGDVLRSDDWPGGRAATRTSSQGLRKSAGGRTGAAPARGGDAAPRRAALARARGRGGGRVVVAGGRGGARMGRPARRWRRGRRRLAAASGRGRTFVGPAAPRPRRSRMVATAPSSAMRASMPTFARTAAPSGVRWPLPGGLPCASVEILAPQRCAPR
jgi:hypothetical protein